MTRSSAVEHRDGADSRAARLFECAVRNPGDTIPFGRPSMLSAIAIRPGRSRTTVASESLNLPTSGARRETATRSDKHIGDGTCRERPTQFPLTLSSRQQPVYGAAA